jgi:hypothetical protein
VCDDHSDGDTDGHDVGDGGRSDDGGEDIVMVMKLVVGDKDENNSSR